jgi:hypothetical protein
MEPSLRKQWQKVIARTEPASISPTQLNHETIHSTNCTTNPAKTPSQPRTQRALKNKYILTPLSPHTCPSNRRRYHNDCIPKQPRTKNGDAVSTQCTSTRSNTREEDTRSAHLQCSQTQTSELRSHVASDEALYSRSVVRRPRPEQTRK